MNFKVNDTVEFRLIAGPAATNGQPGQIKGTITQLTKGHALVAFTFISEGLRLWLTPEGQFAVVPATQNMPSGHLELKVGDVDAVPLSDLAASSKPQQETPKVSEWIARDEAEEIAKGKMGKFYSAGLVDQWIEKKQLTISPKGKINRCELLGWINMWCSVSEIAYKEQDKFGDEAQEFNRLKAKYKDRLASAGL